MGNAQSSLFAPLSTPLVFLMRAATAGIRSLSGQQRRHYASHKQGELGLAKLVGHRAMVVETLSERRTKLRGGKVLVRVLLRYDGSRSFLGGNGKAIRPGDTISATLILGECPGEFIVKGAGQDRIPADAFFQWEGRNRPGNIFSRTQ